MRGMLQSLGLTKPDIKAEGIKWRREIRAQQRQIDSKIRAIEGEEIKTQKVLRDAAKQNDMKTCRMLATQLVRSRKAVKNLRVHKGQLGSLVLQIQEKIALANVSKNFTKSSELASMLGKLIKVPQLTNSISTISSELQKAGIVSDLIDEAVDIAHSDEEIEEEVENEINKILGSISEDISKTEVSKKPTAIPIKEEPTEDVDLSKDLDSLAQRFHVLKS